MELTLANGRRVEIKKIDIAARQVDYKRLDDPIYGGDLILYHPFTNEATIDEELLAALNASEAEREAIQTAADLVIEQERLAEIALEAAKAQVILENLPSWSQVAMAIDNISNLADAKAFIKKLSRVVYLDLKNSVD